MKPILIKNLKRKDLLSLPVRNWQEEKIYEFLLLTSTGQKHDSGYSLMAIIGVNYGNLKDYWEAEIAAYCDDINWKFPKEHPYYKHNSSPMRTDCMWPSRIIRVWGSGEHYFTGKFKVGVSLSSTEVTLIVKPVGDGINQMTGEKIE